MARIIVRVVPAAPDVHDVIPTWRAVCMVKGCAFRSPVHRVKAGADEVARWHRDDHRRRDPAKAAQS